MITTQPIEAILKQACELSNPQGMGYFNFELGPLPDDEAKAIIERQANHQDYHFDYVKGRAVKLGVLKTEDGKLDVLIDECWFDHTELAREELIKFIQTTPEVK